MGKKRGETISDLTPVYMGEEYIIPNKGDNFSNLTRKDWNVNYYNTSINVVCDE